MTDKVVNIGKKAEEEEKSYREGMVAVLLDIAEQISEGKIDHVICVTESIEEEDGPLMYVMGQSPNPLYTYHVLDKQIAEYYIQRELGTDIEDE